jgi:putative SOS response-associated peptidase YedK
VEIDTAAICTTAAGPDTAAIHERQPVILEGAAIEDWLDTGTINAKKAGQLLLPLPAGRVEAIPVSSRVNSNRNDGPELIAPISAPEPAPRPAETPTKKKAAPSTQLDLF